MKRKKTVFSPSVRNCRVAMLCVSQGVCMSIERSGWPGEGWVGRGEYSSAGGGCSSSCSVWWQGGLWWRCLDKDCLLVWPLMWVITQWHSAPVLLSYWENYFSRHVKKQLGGQKGYLMQNSVVSFVTSWESNLHTGQRNKTCGYFTAGYLSFNQFV